MVFLPWRVERDPTTGYEKRACSRLATCTLVHARLFVAYLAFRARPPYVGKSGPFLLPLYLSSGSFYSVDHCRYPAGAIVEVAGGGAGTGCVPGAGCMPDWSGFIGLRRLSKAVPQV
jgi:hypothetical protein